MESAVVVLSPYEPLTFETVVDCGLPSFQEIMAVVVHVESVINIVLPNGWVAIDAVCGVVCCTTSVFFGVN